MAVGRAHVSLVPVTIANNEALSATVELADTEQVAAVIMPQSGSWTAANLTFRVTHDGGTTWSELHNSSGAVQVTGTVGAQLAVAENDFRSVRVLRVRSGTSGSPVNQEAARTLYLVTVSRP